MTRLPPRYTRTDTLFPYTTLFRSAWPAALSSSFLFGGALQPAAIDDRVAQQVPGMLDAIAAEFGLVGLNSLDMLIDGDRYAVIEVNPRPGANLDMFDEVAGAPLFELHLQACDGHLPDPATPAAGRATAREIRRAWGRERVRQGGWM